jgi:hypothetical protein
MLSIGGYPCVIDPERGQLHPWSCNQFLISETNNESVLWDWLTRDCAQTGRPEIKQSLSLSLISSDRKWWIVQCCHDELFMNHAPIVAIGRPS